MYATGQGVKIDLTKAREWWTKAAPQKGTKVPSQFKQLDQKQKDTKP
jgi:TPR repeat protein